MAFNTKDSVWYVGNIGKDLPECISKSPSIEIFNADFSKNLGKISLRGIMQPNSYIQGIAYDSADDAIWFCSFEEGMVRKISKRREVLDSVNIFHPTGICIDEKTRDIYILTMNSIIRLDKDMVIKALNRMEIPAQDQLAFHDGNLYMTSGADYNEPQFLHRINAKTLNVDTCWAMEGSYAIEGLAFKDSILYIANDGLYHSAKVPENKVIMYDAKNLN